MEQVDYRVISTREEAEALCRLIDEEFYQRSPTFVCFEVPKGQMYNNKLVHMLYMIVEEGLSIGVFNKISGELIGGQLNVDLNSPTGISKEQIEEPYKKVYNFLEDNGVAHLEAYLIKKQIPKQKGIVIFGSNIVLQKNYASKGIARKIEILTAQLLRKKGFKYVYVEASSPFAQMMIKEHGFEVLSTVDIPVSNPRYLEERGIQNPKIVFGIKKVSKPTLSRL